MRDPALSYRGALRIVGRDHHPVLEAVDAVLGGVILAAPLLGAAVAPVAALWGWVDQKEQAVGLVRQLLDGGVGRLRGAGGYQRHELLKAAHTVIVGTAFFDGLAQRIGPGYRGLKVTEAEKLRLVAPEDAATVLDRLYEAAAPMPSAAWGFEETVTGRIPPYFTGVAGAALDFLRGLAGWKQLGRQLGDDGALAEAVVREATNRYRSLYVAYAAEVPEFAVWAALTEHAATRRRVEDLHRATVAALDRQAERLTGLERLLLRTAPGEPPGPRSHTGMLGLVNRSVLTSSLVPEGPLAQSIEVSFPTVEEGYVTPRFRYAEFDRDARPAQEGWWARQQVRDDLDAFLAGYFAAPDSTRLPMLLLGHPGAGKSLFTRVLAARLPAEGYTTVRVPLRAVDADAPVWEQIQQALDAATHGRVSWAGVTEESAERVRVVLLDGFDELLLAAGPSAKVAYLQEVAEFQQREYDLQRPVSVIVTSRTVVADRTRLPAGCPMLQLVEFDDRAVGRWLDAWNEANRAAVYARAARPVRAESVLRHADLAQQPLLLLMLALYSADPRVPDLADAVLSMADLYRRLMDTFIRREVAKTLPTGSDAQVARAVETALWHLGIAAFAMFNRRDGLRVSEHELAADFAALLGDAAAGGTGVAERTVGQFFFVQTSEINTRIGLNPNRSYEFLHATFEEFLIALHAVELLGEMAGSWRSARRSSQDVDSRVLRALLSYRCLATRGSIVEFTRELFRALPGDSRQAVRDLVDHLASTARVAPAAGAPAYRPQPDDVVRAVAVYTVNLLHLRVLFAPKGVAALADLTPPHREAPDWWRSTVRLWRAGLTDDEWTVVESVLAGAGERYLVDRTVADRPGPAATGIGELL